MNEEKVNLPNNEMHWKYKPWACKLAKDLTIAYFEQSGTSYQRVEPWMMDRYNLILEKYGKIFENIWKASFKL